MDEGPEGDDWESQIQEIETIDRCDDGTLINGLATEHTVDIVYQKCPQAMLKFYEDRLRFRAK
ncbi:hypothetical protein GGF45_005352 [Coemansia sp. RSA 551]|nr:hypothetical protein GGF45_005352 [Coemansia sp. RSA 551]